MCDGWGFYPSSNSSHKIFQLYQLVHPWKEILRQSLGFSTVFGKWFFPREQGRRKAWKQGWREIQYKNALWSRWLVLDLPGPSEDLMKVVRTVCVAKASRCIYQLAFIPHWEECFLGLYFPQGQAEYTWELSRFPKPSNAKVPEKALPLGRTFEECSEGTSWKLCCVASVQS